MSAKSASRDPASSVHNAARTENRLTTLAIVATLILGFGLTALIYIPVVLLAVLSVSGDPLSGVPGDFTLESYRMLFDTTTWVSPLVLTLEIALVVSLLCMIAATAIGRLLPRMKNRVAPLLLLFLLPLIIPGIMLGVQEFTFFRSFMQIRPGIWLIIVTHFLWAFPFSLLGMLVVTQRFDLRLVEAATDLGASPLRRFWDIERPLIMPGIATAGLFGFLLSMMELSRTIFVRGGSMTLPVHLWALASGRSSLIPLIYSLNTLLAIASIALSVFAVVLLSRAGRVKS